MAFFWASASTFRGASMWGSASGMEQRYLVDDADARCLHDGTAKFGRHAGVSRQAWPWLGDGGDGSVLCRAQALIRRLPLGLARSQATLFHTPNIYTPNAVVPPVVLFYLLIFFYL